MALVVWLVHLLKENQPRKKLTKREPIAKQPEHPRIVYVLYSGSNQIPKDRKKETDIYVTISYQPDLPNELLCRATSDVSFQVYNLILNRRTAIKDITNYFDNRNIGHSPPQNAEEFIHMIQKDNLAILNRYYSHMRSTKAVSAVRKAKEALDDHL